MQMQSELKSYSLVLAGGRVLDPASGMDAVADVAIAGDRIAAIGPGLAANASKVVDVHGLLVTPGLIDMHVHVYPHHFDISVVADGQSFSSGITTMVDAGSAGPANYEHFHQAVVERSRTRVLAFVNIVDLGMGGDFEQDVARMNPARTAEVANAFPEIVGIKMAHYWTWQPWDARHEPWACVDLGVRAGELCGKPTMTDFWPRPPERSYEDLILHHLRPGDIHTHVFAQQFPVLLEGGFLNPVYAAGRKRGVIFDVGHGAGSFWFRWAARALAQGFVPDSISTDLHTRNAANGLVTNLLNVASKLINLGISPEDAIARMTVAPAREIGRPDLGTLRVGGEADLAVLALEEGRFGFIDCGGARLQGGQRLRCRLTVRAGQVVYDPDGLTAPDWQTAPERYWRCRKPEGAPDSWRPPESLYVG